MCAAIIAFSDRSLAPGVSWVKWWISAPTCSHSSLVVNHHRELPLADCLMVCIAAYVAARPLEPEPLQDICIMTAWGLNRSLRGWDLSANPRRTTAARVEVLAAQQQVGNAESQIMLPTLIPEFLNMLHTYVSVISNMLLQPWVMLLGKFSEVGTL